MASSSAPLGLELLVPAGVAQLGIVRARSERKVRNDRAPPRLSPSAAVPTNIGAISKANEGMMEATSRTNQIEHT